MGKKKHDWISDVADQVERHVSAQPKQSGLIVCASGISPSGPIHIGNLREAMTTHLVCEELRRRKHDAVHIHSWDDFDRLRKVPVGVPESYSQHLGKPICDVPDPQGEFESYADRFIVQFEESLSRLGIHPRFIRQSQAYRAGRYNEQIKTAMANKDVIFDVLAKYQTEGRHEKSRDERRREYSPFTVYCEVCGTDNTACTSFDAETGEVRYRCECSKDQGELVTSLGESSPGKLAWKIDWPMRWAYESVDFEPGGEDHATAGSSYTVGRELVKRVYGGRAPCFVKYAFVGIAGRTKMSSSEGTAPTPEWAMRFVEPCMLRWQYVRRKCSDAFEINFGRDLLRVYDEWDGLVKRATADDASERDKLTYQRSVETSTGLAAQSQVRVPFRLLSSAADMTNGNREQILRIVLTEHPDLASHDDIENALEPRLSCAIRWATECLPEDERTQIRTDFAADVYHELPDEVKECLQILLDRLQASFSRYEDLTANIYGAPKLQQGLALDADPTPEIKTRQREFFVAIYELICGSDTGPRLPTLFLSIGLERVYALLSPGGYTT